MSRWFSREPAPPSETSSQVDVTVEDDTGDTTGARAEPLPVPSLKVKRVDYYYNRWTKSWKYKNMGSKVVVETLPVTHSGGSNDEWKEFSFVLVRTLSRNNEEPELKLVIKSEYILKACKDVIRSWPGVSWNSTPLQLDPDIFITFYNEFLEYGKALEDKEKRSQQDEYMLSSVNLLTKSLATDFRATLSQIEHLTKFGEMTFPLLFAILVPRCLMVARCSITDLPRVFQLISWNRVCIQGQPGYQLVLESVDLVDLPVTQTVVIGRVRTQVNIMAFGGTIKIDSLDAYPLKFHHDVEGLKKNLLERGRKWASLIGMHHKQYDGIAATTGGCGDRHNVHSRIMVDRGTFKWLNPGYMFPQAVPPKKEKISGLSSKRFGPSVPMDDLSAVLPVHPMHVYDFDQQAQSISIGSGEAALQVELSDNELLLTPTLVFGFSLSDKLWLQFSVEKIMDIEWNENAFANLVLPEQRKTLLQSLVEAHHKEIHFDDFIKGKGKGLVVNLFGPPGVGKTFSAEATSEHVRSPLYIVGGGDLGTTPGVLDEKLQTIFDIATAWRAIVLIDEADVFLERRSLHDLHRNAMVAVFLRHVEYYRGILFLTTNRVTAFDEAFLSRIHVALHFGELSQESKEQVWIAFIKKMGSAVEDLTKEQISELATRRINGRQIKNAARTAHSLAVGRGEKVKFEHLTLTLDAMEEFTNEFERRNLV
ncbi:hypothetical protein NLJ89_g764 [Agrocybe chaxingu]|uniref:AAA+ ATPase domain-containing protein n=1 Tax=Agrocybe chaxingu TaxID=84603 RepID=A0A9W8N1D0_9AGAR|nr:hypothetical protein NLJ89_g764 [Agrocybe chaxingu]